MSEIKAPRFKVTGRRYSHLKQNLAWDEENNSAESYLDGSTLPEGEDFYRQMFERNRAIKFVVDLSTGRIIKANQAACDFYGYTAEQFKSMHVTDITVLSEDEIVADMQRAVTERGTIFQVRHRLASGEIRDVEAFSGLLEFKNKPYLYAIIQDITDRKKAEKALRESEALYRLLAREMPNTSVVMYDCDLRYTLAEGPYLKRFGPIWDDAVGKMPQEVYTEEQLKVLLPLYKRALQGEAFTFERVTKDYAYQAYLTPLWNDNKEIIGGMVLSHDITEAKQAEKGLRESEARFHSLVDLAPVGIIQTDVDGKRVFCNSRWCEMTGMTLEQALGDEYYETIYPPDLPLASAAWEDMMKSTLPFESLVFRYQRPDKTTTWVSGNGRPLFDENGAVTGYLGTVTDISDHKQLEDELITSHTRFCNIIDFAPVGIVETNAQGEIMLVNIHWSELSGISEFEAFNDHSSSTIHPDDLAIAKAIQQESVEKAIPVNNFEYRFLHSDGKVVWVSDNSRPLFDKFGNVSSHIITMTDITERKRLEEELRQNEERLKTITDNIHDLVTQSDNEGRVSFVSPSVRTLLGIEPEDMIGKLVYDFVHPDDRETMMSAHKATLESGETHISGGGRLRHTDGHYIDIDSEGTILFDAKSNFAGTVLITRDVTERKRLEDALRQNEERLRNITDNLQDMISQSDGDGLLRFVSPSYHTLLGYEVQTLIGTNAMELIHPEDIPNVVQSFQDAFETDTYRLTVECRLRHIDGHYIDVEISGKLFFDSEAKFMGGVFISRDISERKRMQSLLLETEKLQGALEKESELSILKTRMMERIAHEFRTPLTVIQATTETLTYYFDRLTPDQRNAKEITIKGQIQRLTDMLQEIGIVVNGSFSPEHIRRTSTDISVICRELASELEKQFNRPGKFVLDLPDTAVANLDWYVTKNAIMHIMRNAARFSDASTVVNISLSRKEDGICLRVVDGGIGIPAKEQSRIFEPFFRGSNIGEISGLGIGLTIARAAIEAQGGTIQIAGVAGQGTTVTICFAN